MYVHYYCTDKRNEVMEKCRHTAESMLNILFKWTEKRIMKLKSFKLRKIIELVVYVMTHLDNSIIMHNFDTYA